MPIDSLSGQQDVENGYFICIVNGNKFKVIHWKKPSIYSMGWNK